MSAFDLPSAFALDTIDPGALDDPALLRLVAGPMTPADRQREEGLAATSMWFPYRRLDAVDRTHAFVRAYDQAALSLVDKNPNVPLKTRPWLKRRGSYLPPDEVLTPWIKAEKTGRLRLSPRWPQWVAARHAADAYGMIYGDYAYGALIASMARGWANWPGPNLLAAPYLLGTEPDGRPDLTILGYEAKLYGAGLKRTDDPYFTAARFAGDPIQIAYYRFLALQVRHLYGDTQKAERTWRVMQNDGKIVASLSLSALL